MLTGKKRGNSDPRRSTRQTAVHYGSGKSVNLSPPYVTRYDWLALLDMDEVIVPRKHNSWEEMMDEVGAQTKDHCHWSFKNISVSISNISR